MHGLRRLFALLPGARRFRAIRLETDLMLDLLPLDGENRSGGATLFMPAALKRMERCTDIVDFRDLITIWRR